MSVWFYLTEWFTDVPTLGTLARRSIALVILACLSLLVCGFLGAGGDWAVGIVIATFAAQGVLSYFRMRQSQRRLDS